MKKTLKKILTELSLESPDLSYIRGMLEVLLDSEGEFSETLTKDKNGVPIEPVTVNSRYDKEIVLDEATILNNITKANLDKVKNSTND